MYELFVEGLEKIKLHVIVYIDFVHAHLFK